MVLNVCATFLRHGVLSLFSLLACIIVLFCMFSLLTSQCAYIILL